MDADSAKKIYASYSDVYDRLFKWIFFPRISHAVEAMDVKPGECVLDVGIGTGLSLSTYPEHCTVTGIDHSAEMLKQAKQKIREHGYSHISVMEMDAMRLEFPDNAFDKVFISHVVSVVSDPFMVMKEVRRVCKPDGDVVVINHFKSPHPLMGSFSKVFNPISKRIGWRSDLGMDEFISGAGLNVREMYKLKKIDFWDMIFAVNVK